MMKATMIRSFLLPVFVAALGQLPALGVESESVKPAEIKVAAVQMLGYDKTENLFESCPSTSNKFGRQGRTAETCNREGPNCTGRS